MPILRISHSGSHVETSWVSGARGWQAEAPAPPQTDKRPFDFTLTPQDAEDIRWYLEDYRIYPVDPLPKTEARIEKRMKEVGCELFQKVLAGSDVWQSARQRLGDTGIEIETELEDALVPWELLRDPVADLPLALSVPAFVRCYSRPAIPLNPAGQAAGKPRICSPSAARAKRTTCPSAP